MGQLGFFDADRRLQALSARGDPLEAIDRLVPLESFRAEIEAVAQEKQRRPEAVRCHPDVQDAGSTSAQQSVGRAGGISGARPDVVLALSGARDRGQHSGRHDALVVPREAGQGRDSLLEEAGILPEAKWLLAEGADGPSMNRSIPKAKALDDAMIALYQNGERIAPSNGYLMRLLVPGYEGNMNVKWLHRIKLVESPVMAINETMQYTYRVAGPKIWQFFFPMEVKSFITHPSPGLTLKRPGFYEISGLAYSGNGRIAKVMVSADGGKSWGEAALDAPVLSKALTRFRMPWRWDGQPVVLQSRAWDEAGNIQPTREEMFAERGAPKVNVPVTAFPMGHMNVITSWAIDPKGDIKHVYA